MPDKITDQQRRILLKARAKADLSMSRVKDAEAKEDAWAERHDVEPSPVEGHTEIDADVLLAAVNAITGEVDNETSEVIGVYRKSLALSAGTKVTVYSRQLLQILDAVGVKEEAKQPDNKEAVEDAQVQV
jgi:hypothetical protein